MTSKKYESVVEHAAVEAFKKEFERIYRHICIAAEMCRQEGILAFENSLDKEKISNGDILEFGLQLAIDGNESKVIEKYLDSWIEANCSGHCEYYDKILFSVMKTGVLSVQAGENPKKIEMLLKAIVPMELQPERIEFSLEEVKQHGWLIGFIQKEFITEELCCNVIKNCGKSLMYIPKEFITTKLCTIAVKQNGSALGYVPEILKTAELCLEAVKQNGSALEYVPETLKTAELCLEAVKCNGYALKYVPDKFKTLELCEIAVKNYGKALYHVPELFITAELCMKAVKCDCFAFLCVPDKFKILELCIEAVKQDGIILKYVPEALKEKVKEAI